MIRTRNTRQRQVILEELCSTKSHPSAEWLYQRVKVKMPNISLGTVYRNLGVLKNQEIIQELSWVGGQSHYDGNPSPHYHFYCLECGKIEDMDKGYSDSCNKEFKEKMPEYVIMGHRLDVYGLCPQCKDSQPKEL
jgi:Fe2+ or Zn2+ uptake regulation protein